MHSLCGWRYMLKMLITPGEILRFTRHPIGDFWRGIASCKTSRKVTSKGVGMCKVTSGVAWRPVSHMYVRVSDLWRGMAFRKSLTSVSKLKNWMLRQPDQNNKGCLSIQFLLREFYNLRLVDLNNSLKYCVYA